MTEKQEKIINQSVKMLTISEDEAGQRIDNYLLAKLKGVPKSLIYRILRKGEVRVNKGRIKPEYKLQNGDVVRVPPVRVSEKNTTPISKNLNKVASLESHIIFEDDCLLVLNKPSGIAVHGGSGLNFGVIEALRALVSAAARQNTKSKFCLRCLRRRRRLFPSMQLRIFAL